MSWRLLGVSSWGVPVAIDVRVYPISFHKFELHFGWNTAVYIVPAPRGIESETIEIGRDIRLTVERPSPSRTVVWQAAYKTPLERRERQGKAGSP